jgi:hypothetical protein
MQLLFSLVELLLRCGYIRASMQAGIEIGFDWQTALAISAQTVKELLKCSKKKYTGTIN